MLTRVLIQVWVINWLTSTNKQVFDVLDSKDSAPKGNIYPTKLVSEKILKNALLNFGDENAIDRVNFKFDKYIRVFIENIIDVLKLKLTQVYLLFLIIFLLSMWIACNILNTFCNVFFKHKVYSKIEEQHRQPFSEAEYSEFIKEK